MDHQINGLIERISGGTLKSFSELYEAHASLVRSVIYKLCQPQELDDLVQEVFVKIWKGLPKFRQGSQLKTWIYRVAYNSAVDALRKKKVFFQELDEATGESEPKEDRFCRDMILKGLNKLTEEHRTVLVLCCLEELTVEEAALVTKTAVGTVKSRLHYAKANLYEILKREGVSL